jgi:hypothetical protein
LRQNRRATIQPSPLQHLVTGVDKPPDDKKPNPTLGEKAPEIDVSTIPIPEPPEPQEPQEPPPEMVSRDDVEQALSDFLTKLGQSQGRKDKSVISTDKAWQADGKLHQGYSQGSYYTKQGATIHDGKVFDAADLAGKIVGDLPPQIPKKNFDDFKKLRPTDTPEPKKDFDKFKDWAKETFEKGLSGLGVPKKYWPTIEDAIKNHTPDVLDKLPLDPKLKDGIKKIYDEMNKGGDDK